MLFGNNEEENTLFGL